MLRIPFWNLSVPNLFQELQTTSKGLSEEEVRKRLVRYGSNVLKPKKRTDAFTLLIVGVTLVLPFSPLGDLFKFRPLPIPFFLALGAIVVLYILSAEIAKSFFYRNIKS